MNVWKACKGVLVDSGNLGNGLVHNRAQSSAGSRSNQTRRRTIAEIFFPRLVHGGVIVHAGVEVYLQGHGNGDGGCGDADGGGGCVPLLETVMTERQHGLVEGAGWLAVYLLPMLQMGCPVPRL